MQRTIAPARWACVVAVAIAAACHRRAPPTTAPPASSARPPVTAAPPAVKGPLPAPILGTGTGIVEMSRDGTVGRRLAPGLTRHPRYVGPGELVVLATVEDEVISTEPAPVHLVSLASGGSRLVGTFPPFRCRDRTDAGVSDAASDAAEPWPLSLQTEEDFSVTPDGRNVCLTRLDRNLNMADFWLSQRMDLTTGAVTSVLVSGGDRCLPPPGVKVGGHDLCPHEGAAQRADSFPYRFERGKIIRRDPAGDQTVARLKQFTTTEDRSPSARWLVVSRHVEDDENDYIYRQLALLDLGAGQLYPLPEHPAPWPAPFDLSHFNPAAAAEQTVTVTAETDLTWLPFTGDDLLVVGQTLVVPEHRSVPLPGGAAR
jgi:hypothetical protein